MKIQNRLSNQLQNIDGRDYSLYQSLRGKHDFTRFILFIDRIPKDPYAPPYTGIYRVRVRSSLSGFLDDMITPHIRRVALRDFLARKFFNNCEQFSGGRRGTGNSGLITIAQPSQCILERSSCVINEEYVEVRFFIGLPSSGRKIASALAYEMLFKELPAIVSSSLLLENLDSKDIYSQIETCEDADFLRNNLDSKDLVAFVANDSVLPRRSGVDDKPMESTRIVPFRSPDSMRYEFDLPNRGTITGMGIKRGITLIVGGGYHGKSTLLNALEYGIYNHIPGDGREFCVSLKDSVKIRAYSGRYVSNVNISPFLQNIPFQPDTTHFSTENASGSTSQASSIIESIESGASAFYMDEDTCAANFMIRDKRMQKLVSKHNEPITSFIDCVRPLYEQKGISTVLVMGGTGDYFEVADNVIQMQEFMPLNVTDKANKIARSIPVGRKNEFFHSFQNEIKRCPLGNTLDAKNEYGHIRISSGTASELIFGKTFIDLSDVEQLAEKTQTKAIGLAIHTFKRHMNGTVSVSEIITSIKKKMEEEGIDWLNPALTGDIAQFRMIDMAAVINRMRGLEFITQKH